MASGSQGSSFVDGFLPVAVQEILEVGEIEERQSRRTGLVLRLVKGGRQLGQRFAEEEHTLAGGFSDEWRQLRGKHGTLQTVDGQRPAESVEEAATLGFDEFLDLLAHAATPRHDNHVYVTTWHILAPSCAPEQGDGDGYLGEYGDELAGHQTPERLLRGNGGQQERLHRRVLSLKGVLVRRARRALAHCSFKNRCILAEVERTKQVLYAA